MFNAYEQTRWSVLQNSGDHERHVVVLRGAGGKGIGGGQNVGDHLHRKQIGAPQIPLTSLGFPRRGLATALTIWLRKIYLKLWHC